MSVCPNGEGPSFLRQPLLYNDREVVRCDCNRDFQRFLAINCINHKNCPEFFCDLCSYKATKYTVSGHLDSEKHLNRYRRLREHLYLTSLPPPTLAQFKKLSECVERYALDGALNDEDIRWRWVGVARFNDILSRISPDCTVRVYGSTINGFGRKNSNVNIELMRKNGNEDIESSGELLERISQQLFVYRTNEVKYCGIVKEFELKTPRLIFIEDAYSHQLKRSVKTKFELSVTAEKSWKTSNLLHCYSIFDNRVRILGLALRKWASTFKFDNQENGTWPPHAFPILVIHYLQRTDPPVLPCFHEVLQEKMTPKSNPENKDNNEEDTSTDLTEDNIIVLQQVWKSQNTKTIGELFLNLFRYYIFDFNSGTNVVSIRKTTKYDSHSSKGWGTKILAIEDPSRPSCNLSRSVGIIKIYDVFMEVWRNTYKYLLTPHMKERSCFMESDFALNIRPVPSMGQKLSLRLEQAVAARNNDGGNDSDESNTQENTDKSSVFELKKLIVDYGLVLNLNPEIEKFINTLKKSDFFYNFNFENLPFFQRPPKFCRLCHRIGHFQTDCPIEKLPQLVSIPDPIPEMHKVRLNQVCDELFSRHRLDKDDEKRHCTILLSLAMSIKNVFPDSNLELFGSTKNGFGRRDCDLDICLTFKSNSNGDGIDQAEIIKKLAELLSYHDSVSNIEPITQAKVPILKFKFTSLYNMDQRTYECDISLYNLLAVYNTKLLKTYCDIDERVSRLGFIVKHFAKSCEICDASRGSLSSYAYTLMTLHYLQQCQPPVIPVLQELYIDQKPERMIDNWNTWFHEDVNALPFIWPYFRTNKLSVAELFVGFLRYYSEVFKFHKNVVCINQLQPLTKLKKMWTGKRIAIEDPFLLTHNLGQGVDDHMAAFIKTAICKGRNLIGNPPHELPHRYNDWSSYFFDKNRLTEGHLPTGRGCRNCGKIGHKRADCPSTRERRRRPQQVQQQRHQQPNQQQQQHQQTHHQQQQYQQNQTPNWHNHRDRQRQRNENGHSSQYNPNGNQNSGARSQRKPHWQQNSNAAVGRGYRTPRNA